MSLSVTVNNLLRWAQTLAVPTRRAHIERAFPHDPEAFTQGLCVAAGRLFESTGTWEMSALRELHPITGELLQTLPVPGDFAEDITYHGNHLYQLTWKSGRLLKYRLDPLALVEEYRYPHEGWGLASSGSDLVVSDGSAQLRHYGPEAQLRAVGRVRIAGIPFRHLNALEVVGRFAYANVWYSSLIARIDLATAKVTQIIDCSELERIEGQDNPHHILNGIAFDPARERFFVTGKRWRTMFEVTFPL